MRVAAAHFQSTRMPNVSDAPNSGSLGTHYGFTAKGQFCTTILSFLSANSFVGWLVPFPAPRWIIHPTVIAPVGTRKVSPSLTTLSTWMPKPFWCNMGGRNNVLALEEEEGANPLPNEFGAVFDTDIE